MTNEELFEYLCGLVHDIEKGGDVELSQAIYNLIEKESILDETAHSEANFYISRNDGDALKAIHEVLNSHFYHRSEENRKSIINKILDIKEVTL